MTHVSNIKAFISATTECTNELVRVYCALIAIELALKQYVALSDHNVPSGIDRVSLRMAVGPKIGCRQRLTGMAARLRTDLSAISVQSKTFTPRFAPADSYPYLRYARLAGDGWGNPETSPQQLKTLSDTVNEVRMYLKNKFEMPL